MCQDRSTGTGRRASAKVSSLEQRASLFKLIDRNLAAPFLIPCDQPFFDESMARAQKALSANPPVLGGLADLEHGVEPEKYLVVKTSALVDGHRQVAV